MGRLRYSHKELPREVVQMGRQFVLGRFLKSTAAFALVLLFAQSGQASDNPLNLFKRYFGTIDIKSNGRGVRGTGQLDPATGLSLTKCSDAVVNGCTISIPPPGGPNNLQWG